MSGLRVCLMAAVNQLWGIKPIALGTQHSNLFFPLLKPFCKLFWASQPQCLELVHLYVRNKPLIRDCIV